MAKIASIAEQFLHDLKEELLGAIWKAACYTSLKFSFDTLTIIW